jgi:hypothetical protein
MLPRTFVNKLAFRGGFMLAKKEWFKRRKYGGWGVVPRTRNGWVYVLGMIAVAALVSVLPGLTDDIRFWLVLGWTVFVLLDIGPLMVTLPKDERERLHEALAERNAAWAMVAVLVIWLFYEILQAKMLGREAIVHPALIIALLAGAAAKSVTNWRLRKN